MKATSATCAVVIGLLLASASFAGPTVSIQTDASSYGSGDTIEISLSGENSDEGVSVAIYFGLLAPDDSVYTYSSTGWGDLPAPWIPEIFIPSGFSAPPIPFSWVDVPSLMPAVSSDGQYHFVVVLAFPGTFDWLWADMAEFTYSSGPSQIDMVSIPAGSFPMGSPPDEEDRIDNEGPQRTVNISAFKMSRTEITQWQWKNIMGWIDFQPSAGDDIAIVRATWLDSVSFCNKLSESEGLTECYTIENTAYDGYHLVEADIACDFEANGYRLPTEAEWEYVCRAGTTTRFYTGDSEADLARAGWYGENSDGEMHPVGQKEPNSFGIHDPHGNAWEWCWDWQSPDYYGTRPDPDDDPTGPADGLFRIYRGGGCGSAGQDCRSARRGCCSQGTMCVDLGFRIARSE